MSLFSRLFRKAPSRSPVASSVPRPGPHEKADKSPATPRGVDRALAALVEEKALRAAIDAGDVQAVARLVVSGTSTKVRQAAAHAIDDPDVLRQLIRDVRGGNDKSVYKVLTSKRDALLEQARKFEQLRAEIEAASAALERHSQRPYDVLFSERLEQFESRWNAVAAQADPELRERVGQWIERARETRDEHLRAVAAQASRAQAAADAAAEARRLREEQAQASAAAAVEQARLVEEQKRALVDKQEAELQPVRPIVELIRKARAALGDGGTARAAGIRRTIEQKLADAPPLPANVASQLQLLDKQLDELKDWKRFSVAPKRAELIEEMESLVGAAMEPLALAEKIKSLKDEWRSLGKGAGDSTEAEADWQRFQDAAQKAYQPCSEYFAAQALVREENLRQREALLARFTAFEASHDWQQPDWRAVIAALREMKQEWRRYSAVDRSAAKPQQEKFAALTASLQGRLDAEYARNVKQKEALVERARQLLAGDDARKATDAVKQLQQQWRAVGPVPREVDQRLWEEFRQHSDAVFQKRQQDFAAYTAGLEHNKTQAIALCEQVEQIATLEGAELLSRAGALGDTRNAFEALGEFPRAESIELRNRFDRAVERCRASLARQRVRDAEQSWSDLFDAADQVRAYRLAATRGQDTSRLDSLKQAAERAIATVSRGPRHGVDALGQALADEHSADLAANETALKMLCIRAEILTDLSTPPEDQALRRDYQLQRLVQGMGQRLKGDDTQLDSLALEWVRVGPVEDGVYGPLLQRFRHCRERGQAGVDGGA